MEIDLARLGAAPRLDSNLDLVLDLGLDQPARDLFQSREVDLCWRTEDFALAVEQLATDD